MEPVYGEIKCQHGECKNKAYWKCQEKYVCGVHSRNKEREELRKDPKKIKEMKEDALEQRQKIIEEMRKDGKGDLIMTKLLMMKDPQYKPGYIAVFPNRKHGNRKDGLGMPSLSPMVLGPVNHVMRNLPPAKNLENYWQFSKVTKDLVSKRDEFLTIRKKGYEDDEPHRHGYFEGQEIMFSTFFSKNGEERRYNYLQSRVFYCHYYELLVSKEKDLQILKEMLNKGFNLQIFGYDSFEVGSRSMMEHYLDISKPFGHEAVIYSILAISDSKEYPWNKFKEMHPELYEDMF